MAVDAMLAVKTINPRGEIKYPVKAVNILKAHGKSATESIYVKGYALNCTVASQGPSSSLPCVALTQGPSDEDEDRGRQDCVSGHEPNEGAHAPRCAHHHRRP